MGRATNLATDSAWICPIRFGTSSPMTIEKYVTSATTAPVAR